MICKIVLLIALINCMSIVQCQLSNFNCCKEGFFATEQCEVYYLCAKTASDTFYALRLECPEGQKFSNVKQQCVSSEGFQCGSFVCPSEGRFPNIKSIACKTYHVCRNIGGVLDYSLSSCPDSTVFSWIGRRCVPGERFECPIENETVTENDIETSIATTENTSPAESSIITNEFECKESGRFPNPVSEDCSTYIGCSIDPANGGYSQVLFSCPISTVFSPIQRRCVTSSQYTCYASEATFTDAISTENPTFSCPGIGRFPNEEAPECKTYYSCSVDVNGDLSSMLVICPQATIFSWEIRRCVSESQFICPNTFFTTHETTFLQSESTTISTEDITYDCRSTGRFPNIYSATCSTYFICTRDIVTNELIATRASCPTDSVFSKEAHRCVPSAVYSCPEDSEINALPSN